MNTKSAMRSALATLAAGALVLGSAGAATAKPDKAKGPKQVSDTVTLKKVDIKRHKYVDLAKIDEATALKLRAKVRHRVKAETDEAASISVTLGVYTKKVRGEMVEGTVASDDVVLAPVVKAKAKKNHYFKGDAVLASIWGAEDVAALQELLKPGDKAYICIASATPSFDIDKYSKQTQKRLGLKAPGGDAVKRTVRDCVKVIDSSPEIPQTPETPESTS